MKFTFILLSILFSIAARSQTTFTIEQAKEHVGDTITVCGEVFETYVSKDNGNLFANFGGGYPNQILNIVIYESDFKNFTNTHEIFYPHKNVCITGEVKLYHDKPEIILRNSSQISHDETH